jgi:hypothetical protein
MIESLKKNRFSKKITDCSAEKEIQKPLEALKIQANNKI